MLVFIGYHVTIALVVRAIHRYLSLRGTSIQDVGVGSYDKCLYL